MGKRKLDCSYTGDDDNDGFIKRSKKSKKTHQVDVTLEENGGEISLQISQEKKRALEIIDSMLPTDDAKGSIQKGTVISENSAGEKDQNHVGCSSRTDSLQNQPDRFYTVNADLKQLFSATNNRNKQVFSFLEEREQDKSDSKVSFNSAGENAGRKKTKNKKGQLKTVDGLKQEQKHADTTTNPKFFFFHSHNKWRNRLEEHSFYRIKSLEELESNWPERRTAMKQSFRKRHKEALKLERKRRYGTRT